jgi:hypothetical protein
MKNSLSNISGPCDVNYTWRIWMKFGMDVKPLKATVDSYFSISYNEY